MITAILLLQSPVPMIDLAQPRSPELDAANDCLVAKTREWLREYDWRPETDERWRWATAIVDQCADLVTASALPIHDPESPQRKLIEAGALVSLGAESDLRRVEALYYVDGMIAAHFAERGL